MEKAVITKSSPMLRIRKESIPADLKSEIVMNWIYMNKKKLEVAEQTGISFQVIVYVLSEFKILERSSRKIRKSLNMKHTKVKERHLKYMLKFFETNSSKGFTLGELRSHLIKKCPDLHNISVSTLSRLFRHRLSLSYKKLGKNSPKKVDPDSRSLLTSWCRAIIGLLNSRFHLIFVDEFVINRNTIHTYGWTHKGKPNRLLMRPKDFKMSFVVAHSRERERVSWARELHLININSLNSSDTYWKKLKEKELLIIESWWLLQITAGSTKLKMWDN